MNTRPFFVYGTLREGFGNDRILRPFDVTFEKGAHLSGAKMTNIGFPYVYRVDDAQADVTGEIVRIAENDYEAAVRALDALEGYHGPNQYNHYERVVTEVTDAQGDTVEVYTYLVDEARAHEYGVPVPSGDFADVAGKRRRAYAGV